MITIECRDSQVGRLISFYEFNQLRKKDRCRFEEHLMECRFCSRELREMLPIVRALRQHRAELLERLSGEGISYAQQKRILLEAYQSQGAAVGSRGRLEVLERWLRRLVRPRVLIPAVGAAAAVVLILALPWSKPGNPYRPYLDQTPAPYTESTVRGSVSPVPEAAWQAFDAGMADYGRGEYGKAAGRLQQAAKLAPAESEFQLYLGVSRYLAGQPKAAVEALTQALSARDLVIRGTARWYLAQAWLAQSDAGKAQPLLEEIAQQEGGYAPQAASLLEKIRAMK
jgi:tetratricopeptide (TPR) repeat protein